MKMEERNKHTLDAAIKGLKQYDPPTELWSKINAVMDADRAINVRVEALPTHTPPSNLWNKIQESLPEKEAIKSTEPKVVPLWKKLSIAASFLLVLSAGMWLFSRDYSDLEYTVTTEKVNPKIFRSTWHEDDASFDVVIQEISTSPVLSKQEDVKRMLYEWQELQAARVEVEDMIRRYGNDAQVLDQIKDIELDRTVLIKKMATYL